MLQGAARRSARLSIQVGSTRNAEFSYRFDDKSGHRRKARFVDDYKRVIIEDKNEVAQFVAETATSNVLYVLIRSINRGRSSAEFRLDGTPAAINAAFAGCPIAPGKSAGIAAMPGPAPTEAHLYFGSRSSSSMEMPCGPRRKQILMPGRGMVGSMVNSTPFFLISAAIASRPVTDSPKWSSP